MIIVDNVYKRYLTKHGPGEWILKGVSFTIPSKVSVGVLGGNGAGKSTLLKLISGVDSPTRGTIERRCQVSWPMGSGAGLQKNLSGRKNAKFVCRIHGHTHDMADRLAYIESFAELGAAFDEPISTYSGGMKARLQFAMSLAFDFDVYVTEATGAGDVTFRDKAKDAFESLTDHASVIMVSNAEETLRKFCQAGIWLYQGKAYWFDDLEDALKHYKEALGIEDKNIKRKQKRKLLLETIKDNQAENDVLDESRAEHLHKQQETEEYPQKWLQNRKRRLELNQIEQKQKKRLKNRERLNKNKTNELKRPREHRNDSPLEG